jgi:hypothetical protein
MVRDGYFARWRGEEYEATPSSAGAHLYASRPTEPGFDELVPGRCRRIVPFDELDEFGYLTTVGSWRGEPVKVLAEHGQWLRVEYTGGSAPVAERAGLEPFDRGVYQSWVPREEVADLREERG